MKGRFKAIGIQTALAFAAVLVLLPIVVLILSSLKTDVELSRGALGLPESLQWKNYKMVWIEARFKTYLANSLIIGICTTLLVLILSALAGFGFSKFNFLGQNVLFLFILMGLMLPPTVIIIPLYYRLRDLGLLDTLPGIFLPLVGLGIPFGTFLMRQFFKDVPNELLDAAIIDGCNRFTAFLFVFLPIAKGGLQSLAVVQFMFAWREYFLPLIISQSDKTQTLTVGLYRLYKSYVASYARIAAGTILVFLPILVVYIILQRRFATGMIAGSLKG